MRRFAESMPHHQPIGDYRHVMCINIPGSTSGRYHMTLMRGPVITDNDGSFSWRRFYSFVVRNNETVEMRVCSNYDACRYCSMSSSVTRCPACGAIITYKTASYTIERCVCGSMLGITKCMHKILPAVTAIAYGEQFKQDDDII